MNRRHFVETMGILGASTLLPIPGYSMFNSPKYKMGLQLYSIHEEMTKDPVATLKAVKALGYEDFETFGFDAEKGTFYNYKSPEFRKILEELQLTASSGHFGFSSYLEKNDDELNGL